MQMAYATDTRASGVTLGQRITDMIASLSDHVEKRKVYRATYAELAALTTRDLDDLGISRAMIGSIAEKAAYGK